MITLSNNYLEWLFFSFIFKDPPLHEINKNNAINESGTKITLSNFNIHVPKVGVIGIQIPHLLDHY